MSWLIVAILSYFLFSLVAIGDKFLLAGPPKPKLYSFYANTLGGLIILLIPFVGFTILPFWEAFFCILTGAIFLFALLALYEGLEKYEASRIIPAMGGFTPVFTFCLAFLFSGGKEILSFAEIAAFILLIAGSIIISKDPLKKLSKNSLTIAAISAFFLALYFVLAKYVFLMLPFWHGLIWIKIGSLITSLFLLFSKDVQAEIFKKKSQKSSFSKKTGALFILNQIFGASAAILQNWAIALAGIAYISLVAALQGVQYLFILIIAFALAWKFPKILKENFSKKIIIQKLISVILIAAGLAIIALI